MKYIIIFCALIFLPYLQYAQDTSLVTQDQLDQRSAGLSDSMAQIGKQVAKIQENVSPADFAAPQSVIDSVKNAPCQLYTTPICGVKWVYQYGGWILFAIILIGGFYLFATTSLCRDESFDAAGNLRPIKERPYSYSRVQFFWWTMIILCCYVAFFARYGNLIPLNMTTVLLLGLGSTVYAGGKILDDRQKKINPIGTRNQDSNASKSSLFKDILTDDGGVSIHRFQTLVFNVAFGIGFVSYFVTSYCKDFCRYPFLDLNDWQFALLGISSATYLGMKAAENNPATPPPPPPSGTSGPNPTPPDPPANTTTTM